MKKIANLIFDAIAVLIFIWILLSVFEIGFTSPLAESHEYSKYNFFTLFFGL